MGFSNGCEELVLKKPPPFVPSCLIATWDAAGPWAMVCALPSRVVAVVYVIEVLNHALRAEEQRPDQRERQQDIYRAANHSTQKLPMVFCWRRASPRTSAMATAMPAAADTKFCTVRPTI